MSDTRVTIRRPSGLYETRDEFIKAFVVSKRISAVAAGQVSLAAFILNNLKNRISDTAYTPELKRVIIHDLEQIVRDYVNAFGRVGETAAFIFAGYDGQPVKRIESSRLGNALSGELRARASGGVVASPQAVDPVIAEGLRRGIEAHGGLRRGQYIDVDLPGSEMFTVLVVTEQHRIHIQQEEIECYDYAVFHPNQHFASVTMPIDIVSRLEFPLGEPRTSSDIRETIYPEAQILTTFVLRVTSEQGFGGTVGGHVFVALQTDGYGFIFPTGELGEVREGRIVRIGSIFVRNGDICYRFPDGREGQYRMLQRADGLAQLDII